HLVGLRFAGRWRRRQRRCDRRRWRSWWGNVARWRAARRDRVAQVRLRRQTRWRCASIRRIAERDRLLPHVKGRYGLHRLRDRHRGWVADRRRAAGAGVPVIAIERQAEQHLAGRDGLRRVGGHAADPVDRRDRARTAEWTAEL